MQYNQLLSIHQWTCNGLMTVKYTENLANNFTRACNLLCIHYYLLASLFLTVFLTHESIACSLMYLHVIKPYSRSTKFSWHFLVNVIDVWDGRTSKCASLSRTLDNTVGGQNRKFWLSGPKIQTKFSKFCSKFLSTVTDLATRACSFLSQNSDIRGYKKGGFWLWGSLGCTTCRV